MRQRFGLIVRPLRCAVDHRHLLGGFVSKDVKGRFAGSVGGVCWTLLHPLATIFIYLFVFSLVLRIEVTVGETGTDRFGIYLLCGLFPWLIFSDGLGRSAGSLIQNASLITRVVFPVELLPLAAVTAALLINGIGLILFLGYLVIAGYAHITWLMLLVLIPILILFTWGLALMLSAGSVFIRDIPELLSIVLMVLFFATPIVYPASLIPEQFQWLLGWNPVSVFVKLFREVLLVHQINWLLLGKGAGLSTAAYLIGAWFFGRAKPGFGDVL